MKRLTKITAFLLALVMLFLLTSCVGEYEGPTGPGGSGGGGGDDDTGYVPPVMNDDPTDDFTVTLTADGQPYTPRMNMYVYWSDGFSVHTAKVDNEGVARIDGLDGDYRVTLSAVPNEYTYDPNSNIATNDDRNIVIELYTLNMLSGGGTGIYDCLHFRKTGVYSAVIDSADDAIYFQYAPETSGTYTIESWIDTTADNINPYIDVYGGSSQFKYYIKTTNDGGAVGSYTINFVHTVQIAADNISAGGQAVYTFAIKAESKNNKYPITITFAVKRDGEFELPSTSGGNGTSANMATPEFDFTGFDKAAHEYGDEYAIMYPEYQLSAGSSTYVFDDSRFKVWEKKNGGDGFYHVYDKDKYPETDGYGPILYAYITEACRFIDRPFSMIEYNTSGETINAALSAGGKNYKHLIEGYTALATHGNINGTSYYCSSECTCHDAAISISGWACAAKRVESTDKDGNIIVTYVKCDKCTLSCRPCPEELIGYEGYQSYANSDGLAPVTPELQKFLAAYCKKELFFYDGRGTYENTLVDGRYFQAVGESGWLFACAYYEKQ